MNNRSFVRHSWALFHYEIAKADFIGSACGPIQVHEFAFSEDEDG